MGLGAINTVHSSTSGKSAGSVNIASPSVQSLVRPSVTSSHSSHMDINSHNVHYVDKYISEPITGLGATNTVHSSTSGKSAGSVNIASPTVKSFDRLLVNSIQSQYMDRSSRNISNVNSYTPTSSESSDTFYHKSARSEFYHSNLQQHNYDTNSFKRHRVMQSSTINNSKPSSSMGPNLSIKLSSGDS